MLDNPISEQELVAAPHMAATTGTYHIEKGLHTRRSMWQTYHKIRLSGQLPNSEPVNGDTHDRESPPNETLLFSINRIF
jgi:hypothetical protein